MLATRWTGGWVLGLTALATIAVAVKVTPRHHHPHHRWQHIPLMPTGHCADAPKQVVVKAPPPTPDQVLQTAKSELLRCLAVDDGWAADDHGLTVVLHVAPDGHVVRAHAQDGKLSSCMKQVFETLQFPTVTTASTMMVPIVARRK